MRFLAALLFLIALGVLVVVAWPLVHREEAKGPRMIGPAPTERAQVVAPDAVTHRVAVSAADPAPPSDEPKASSDMASSSGPLCDRAPEGPRAEVISLPSGPTLRTGPPTSGPMWTWVNLWAAWCKPCKEEMPLLSSWAAHLRSRGVPLRVLFLSVDDDERQLERFMAGAGRALPDEFRWAKDEAARSRFYRALGIEDPPTLPVQVLVDPEGRLRCLRVGSITESDLDEAARRFGWR